MDKKLHQGYIVHSQRLDALFRAHKEQKIGEGCHFSQPSPLARVVKLSLGSFPLGSMIGALGCLVAVGVATTEPLLLVKPKNKKSDHVTISVRRGGWRNDRLAR